MVPCIGARTAPRLGSRGAHLVPENRLRVYDVREVIGTLFDAGSVLELRRAFGPERVARMDEVGKAVSMATHFEIDGVIDPAETRDWIIAGLRAAPMPPRRTGKKRPLVDTW